MTLSVDQVLSKAKRHARRGETDLAAQQYQSVLEKFPKNKRAIDGLKNLRQPNKGKRVTGAEPSQMQLNGLITTYNQGNLQAALEQGEALAKQFPSAAFIPNLLGVVNADLGQLERAVACHTSAVQMMPDFAEAHYNLGNVLNSLGKPEEAVASLTRAVQIKPDFAEAHNNLGNALNALGKPEEAVSSFTKALQIEPALAEVHYNLGAAFITLGKHEEAVTSLTKAVQINPEYAEAHNNLGTALNVLGRPEEALPSLTSAVQIKPDFAEAHNNLGNAFNALGKHEQAVASLTKAVQIIPEYAEAHNNLGAAQNDLGRHDEAIAHYRKAVSLAPDRKEFWHNFSVLLGAISFDVYDQEWADIYLGLLAQKTVARPSMVAKSILGLVKQHPSIRKALQFSTGDDGKISPFDVCSSLSDVPLFLHIIKLSPVPDLEVEDLLRGLRSALLFNGDVAVDRERLLGFQVSLALHCFANEFVFGETDEETLAVQALEATIEGLAAGGEDLDSFKIACLASYRPLHRYGWSRELTVVESLQELFERQVNQVREEASIRTKIRTFGRIEDKVSTVVREQYEENPYPRWENTALYAKPKPIHAIVNSLELKLIDDTGNFVDRPEILIAGCGTGQQALCTATRFLNCKVLAIDLSLGSISYAIRKSQELGITNIEYMQGDILDLGSLDKQFDIVESTGVLHHMGDPMVGWQILADRLKPGGLMNIGLYSEIARKHIVAARGIISEMGLSDSSQDMLKFRVAFLDPNGKMFSELRKITDSGAFFSTSELRDLLFHVQEHRFTLPQIKENLDILGLTFAGFEFSDNQLGRKFVQDNPDPQALHSLDRWHEFEIANPDTFRGMYQFWMQKNARCEAD